MQASVFVSLISHVQPVTFTICLLSTQAIYRQRTCFVPRLNGVCFPTILRLSMIDSPEGLLEAAMNQPST